jgi:hypothetical protein
MARKPDCIGTFSRNTEDRVDEVLVVMPNGLVIMYSGLPALRGQFQHHIYIKSFLPVRVELDEHA